MNTLPLEDPVLQDLQRLPAVYPTAAHREMVRDLCHETLAKRRSRAAHAPPARFRRPVESTLVGAFSIVYIATILYTALRTYGL